MESNKTLIWKSPNHLKNLKMLRFFRKNIDKEHLKQLRIDLLNLGFSDTPLCILKEIANSSKPLGIRAIAAREVALWLSRKELPQELYEAIEYASLSQELSSDPYFKAKAETIKLVCMHALGIAPAFTEYSLDWGLRKIAFTPDLLLATANHKNTVAEKLQIINLVLYSYNLAPLACVKDDHRSPYDALTSSISLKCSNGGPLVSVIIAAYNSPGTIATAIRSLQEQTWKNLEIIIVDDCSPTEETIAVAEKYAQNDKRIRMLKLPINRGAYVARNFGLNVCKGEYVTLHDSDDWSHPSKIEKQVRHLLANPGIIANQSLQVRATNDLNFTRLLSDGSLITANASSLMFRRAPVVSHLGCWDTVRFSADNEFIRRLKKVFGEKSVHLINKSLFSFQRDSSASVINSESLGINGFLFGARREYLNAQRFAHNFTKDVKYSVNSPRAFPAPLIMNSNREESFEKNRELYSSAIATDFRQSSLECRKALRHCSYLIRSRSTFFVFELNKLLSDSRVIRKSRESACKLARRAFHKENIRIAVYGETLRCENLYIYNPSVVSHQQRYTPLIIPQRVNIIASSRFFQSSTLNKTQDDIISAISNLNSLFNCSIIWHPEDGHARELLESISMQKAYDLEISSSNWRIDKVCVKE
jgi:glycosyltransferase involved in cell wall biosynthesis